MIRSAVSGILILLMLVQTFSKTIIFTSFKINQDYIAKNLCENRGAPEKHCCGKCLLRKKMEQDEQRNSKLPGSLKTLDETVLMCKESGSNEFVSYCNGEISFADFSLTITSSTEEDIFHPPSVVSC